MKNILIPTDFSSNAWNAVKYAKRLYQSTACNFHLLHVSDYTVESSASSFSSNAGLGIEEQLVLSSKKQLRKLIQQIEATNTNNQHCFFGIQEDGLFINAIKKHILENKIDLIVMGTKGASGLREHIIGSNTGNVITKVKCNTLIIPKGVKFKEPKEIAFPTDYNIFYSHQILNALTELLHLSKGNLRIMNVSKMKRSLTNLQQNNKAYLSDYLQETHSENSSFHTITNKNVKSAIQCFVESRDVDMIVMVAKNLNFIQQILFDSIVEKISFHTTVPFYVLHQ